MNVNQVRKQYLVFAELLDALRVVPRLLVSAYSFLVWDTVQWYQTLPDPTTQHTALVSAIVGASAVVFGFYTNSGTNWRDGFVSWEAKKTPPVVAAPPVEPIEPATPNKVK